jgi:hypothetical protein
LVAFRVSVARSINCTTSPRLWWPLNPT